MTFSAFFWLAVWFPAFSTIIALFAFWKLLELLYIGFEHKLRIIVSSISVQNLNRAAPATFRTQIEQIRTHFEQPQIRFRTKWKIWMLFEPQLKGTVSWVLNAGFFSSNISPVLRIRIRIREDPSLFCWIRIWIRNFRSWFGFRFRFRFGSGSGSGSSKLISTVGTC